MTSRYTHCIHRLIILRMNKSAFLMSTSDWRGPSPQESSKGSHPQSLLTVVEPIQTLSKPQPETKLIPLPRLEICISLVSLPNGRTKRRLIKIWRPSRSRWKNPQASMIYWVKNPFHIKRKIAPHSAMSPNIPDSRPRLRARIRYHSSHLQRLISRF